MAADHRTGELGGARPEPPPQAVSRVGYAGDPNHGPGHHLHLSWLAGAGLGGAGMGGRAAEIRRVLMGGGEGLGTVGAPRPARIGCHTRRRAGPAGFACAWHGRRGQGVGGRSAGAGATGDGAALMRQITKRYGWNFADWWALDAKETSHGRNLSNPTSTARLRGQFLDMNWGKYGPGSDPVEEPVDGAADRGDGGLHQGALRQPVRGVGPSSKPQLVRRGRHRRAEGQEDPSEAESHTVSHPWPAADEREGEEVQAIEVPRQGARRGTAARADRGDGRPARAREPPLRRHGPRLQPHRRGAVGHGRERQRGPQRAGHRASGS